MSDMPGRIGLYDPRFEHDACGVSFVAHIKGVASHELVRTGLDALTNLEHRGATGAEADTGDGAGILVQVPDAFFRASVQTELPEAGREHFLRLWTCKEAMSKATGDGLSAPLSRLSVSASADTLRLDDGPPPYVPADWRLIAVEVPNTHVATAALWRPSTG